MNRTVTGWSTLGVALALTVPVGSAFAQVPFKVSRPQDGARVREIVRLQMSRAALQGVKYLSLSVDGKFRAGVAIPEPQFEKSGKVKPLKTDLVYADDQVVAILWNTKALMADPNNPGILEGVEDGPHTIDIKAFDASNRAVGKESLTLEVDNKGGLRVPAEGILLAYRFQIGEEVNYRQKTDVEFIGERTAPPADQNIGGFNGFASQGRGQGGGFGGGFGGGIPGGMTGPGAMMGGSSGMGRRGGGPGGPGGMTGPGAMMGGSSGMGAMMGGPGGVRGGMMGGFGGFAGRGGGGVGAGAFEATGPFTLPVQSVRANYERSIEDRVSGAAFFMRDKVKNGTIVAGNGASARLQDVYDFKSRYRTVGTSGAVYDPGVANAAHPGAYVALPMIDLGGARRRIGQTWPTQAPLLLEWASLDTPPMVRATNTLESLEWQDGYQTARIKQTFEGRANVPIFGGAGEIRGAKVKMDRTIWFGFKAGKIVRMETTTEVEGDAPAALLNAMVPGAGAATGGAMGAGMMGGGLMMGGAGGPMMGGMGGSSGMGAMMGGMGGSSGMGAMMGGMGGSSGMGAMMGGGMQGGFGGMQGGGQQEVALAPAKFKSVTVVELVPRTPARRVATK